MISSAIFVSDGVMVDIENIGFGAFGVWTWPGGPHLGDYLGTIRI